MKHTRLVKYRPVLTANQITHILNLAKLENPLSDISLSVISTLSVFQTKIDNAAVLPAYSSIQSTASASTAVTREEKQLLDLGEIPATSGASTSAALAHSGIYPNATDLVDKEVYWEECHTKYKYTPELCSVKELSAAQEHMYLNDLMTAEQEAAWEAKIARELDL